MNCLGLCLDIQRLSTVGGFSHIYAGDRGEKLLFSHPKVITIPRNSVRERDNQCTPDITSPYWSRIMAIGDVVRSFLSFSTWAPFLGISSHMMSAEEKYVFLSYDDST